MAMNLNTSLYNGGCSFAGLNPAN